MRFSCAFGLVITACALILAGCRSDISGLIRGRVYLSGADCGRPHVAYDSVDGKRLAVRR